MGPPILHINSISAKGLDLMEMISCCSNNKGVYADVFIRGSNKSAKQKTPIDKAGGPNPLWKFPMMFSINVDVPQSQQTFVVKLKVVGFLSDKVIGLVHVPMVELLKGYVDTKGENRMSCSVMTPGGDKDKGVLDIDFEIKELIAYAGADDGAVPVSVPVPGAAQPQNPSKFRNVAAWIGAGAGVVNAFIGIFGN